MMKTVLINAVPNKSRARLFVERTGMRSCYSVASMLKIDSDGLVLKISSNYLDASLKQKNPDKAFELFDKSSEPSSKKVETALKLGEKFLISNPLNASRVLKDAITSKDANSEQRAEAAILLYNILVLHPEIQILHKNTEVRQQIKVNFDELAPRLSQEQLEHFSRLVDFINAFIAMIYEDSRMPEALGLFVPKITNRPETTVVLYDLLIKSSKPTDFLLLPLYVSKANELDPKGAAKRNREVAERMVKVGYENRKVFPETTEVCYKYAREIDHSVEIPLGA